MVEVFAIPNQEAVTVAEKLVEEVFCRFSIPEQLHSDQGRQFEGKLMQDVCRLLHIDKTRTTAYHPQSDGLVERLNRTLLSMLAATVHEHPGDWDKKLRLVCMAYNTSVHQSTGFSPFFSIVWPSSEATCRSCLWDCPYGRDDNTGVCQKPATTLEEAYSTVRNRTGAALERQKELYNRKVHGDEYQVGDLVWLHNPVIPKGAKRKLHCPWTGPYRVVKKLSTVVYRIQDTNRRKRLVVHFDRLKPCPSMQAARPGKDHSPQEVENQLPLMQEHCHVGTDLRIVDDDEESLEIQPRDRGQMRMPRQQELPELQALEDGHEALERDIQNEEQEVPFQEEVAMQNDELPQQEVPSQEEVVQNQHRYPRRNRRAPVYYGAVPYS